MDKFNNPSGNVNNNDNNPWDYQPDQIDNTQEIPAVDNTEPTGENATNNEPDHAPEHTPSNHYNAPETKHKSHIGRNLFIGAVAVAVAGTVALFNGGQTSATAPEEPVPSEQISTDEDHNQPSLSSQTDNPNTESYDKAPSHADGLSIEEFANTCDASTLEQAYANEGGDLELRLAGRMEDMGYNVTNSGMRTTYDGVLCAAALGDFDLIDNSDKFGQIQVLAQIESNSFNIQLSVFPFDVETDKAVQYDTDTIPTPEEAAQILADNS